MLCGLCCSAALLFVQVVLFPVVSALLLRQFHEPPVSPRAVCVAGVCCDKILTGRRRKEGFVLWLSLSGCFFRWEVQKGSHLDFKISQGQDGESGGFLEFEYDWVLAQLGITVKSLPLLEVGAGCWQVCLGMDRGAGQKMSWAVRYPGMRVGRSAACAGLCRCAGCPSSRRNHACPALPHQCCWSSDAPKCSLFLLTLSLFMSSNCKKN